MNHKIISNINKLAYPILLNYLLLNLFEILDKAIIGHYSLEGFALIGIVAPPIYEITGALGVLSVAFHILAAEQTGKGNPSALEDLFLTAKYIAVFVSGIFLVIGFVGGRYFFQTLYHQEGAQLNALLSYFYPDILTMPLNFLIFLYSAYYRNKLCTKISFYSTAISTAVNLFFDIGLVNGYWGMPELGIAGAAWGSVIGLIAGLLVYQIPHFLKRRNADKGRFQYAAFKQLFRFYPTLFGQEFLEGTLFVLVLSAAVARLSLRQMAVYNLLDSVVSILSVSIYAYAASIQTYALQSQAAGNTSLTKSYLRQGCLFTVIAMFLLCTTAFLLRQPILGWIVAEPAVNSAAVPMMFFAFLPIFPKAVCEIYMEYLQGSRKDRFVLWCTAVSGIISGILVLWAANLAQLYGIYAVLTLEYTVLSILYAAAAHKHCQKQL